MMVSNLAVTAAEAIGADFLLCRVGAYFHDIGKAENPEYFAENEPYGGRSRHEDLKPSLSASVIRSHVTQGLKIAKEHGLPGAVRDFIPQHHGTSVIRYFYGKALDSRQVGPEYEGEFRYSGPKPQSRETAIVMLSDSVDAVSRTLEKPSPSSIEDAVRDTIRHRLLDGDLDESNLTLADLNTVAETFIKVLNGTFHNRPEYPARDEPETQETRNGGGNRKKSKRSSPPVHPGKGG
jgi:putative nucleotidyltransferase with HDIG domain